MFYMASNKFVFPHVDSDMHISALYYDPYVNGRQLSWHKKRLKNSHPYFLINRRASMFYQLFFKQKQPDNKSHEKNTFDLDSFTEHKFRSWQDYPVHANSLKILTFRPNLQQFLLHPELLSWQLRCKVWVMHGTVLVVAKNQKMTCFVKRLTYSCVHSAFVLLKACRCVPGPGPLTTWGNNDGTSSRLCLTETNKVTYA